MTNSEKFIELVRYVMRENRWNMKRLALELGYSYTYLRKIMSGSQTVAEKYWAPIVSYCARMWVTHTDIYKAAETVMALRKEPMISEPETKYGA